MEDVETFLVRVQKGTVTNARKMTKREGFWIPLDNLPAYVARELGCIKKDARPTLAWDTLKGQWRDMRHAKMTGTVWSNAVLVTMPNGQKGVALLDFD